MSDTVGVEISPGRFVTVAATVRRFLDDPQLVGSIADLASLMREALRTASPASACSTPLPTDDHATRSADAQLQADPRRRGRSERIETDSRGRPAAQAAGAADDHPVDGVGRGGARGRRRHRAVRLGLAAITRVWRSRRSTSARRCTPGSGSDHTAILTSATIPASLGRRVGLARRPQHRRRRRRQPVRLRAAGDALLRDAPAAAEVTEVPRRSRRGTDRADRRRRRTNARPVHQLGGDGRSRRGGARRGRRADPHPARSPETGARSRSSPSRRRPACSRRPGMFQGVDVPGETLSLVVIDKLPFPRPDDPLLSARREQLGPSAFSEIDVPRAATLLAQACGRLIRNGRPIAASSPSSTHASARPATAGTSSRRSRR